MELKTYIVQDAAGTIVPNASATLYKMDGTIATGLQDSSGQPLANPFRATGDGIVSFSAPNGEYEIAFGIGPVTGPRIRISFLDVTQQVDQITDALNKTLTAQASAEAVNNSQTYFTIAAGMAASAINQVFRVPAPTTQPLNGFTYYLKSSATGYTVLQTTPSTAALNDLVKTLTGKLETYRFEDLIQVAKQGSGMIYCVRDRDGRQTWLGISDVDGGPSPWAESMIRQRLGITKREAFAAGEEALFYAVADSQQRITDLALRERDGQLADFVVTRLAKRIGDKLGVTKETIGQLLGDVKMTPDYPGFQIMSSLGRWSASRYKAGAQVIGGAGVQSPWNFATKTYNQAARGTFINGYNGEQPLLLVLYVGGVGSGSDLTVPTYYTDLIPEGVVFARCNYHGDHYGQPQAIQDMVEVYEFMCKLLPIAGVVLLGNSMGGMLALNALTTKAIPGVLGLYLTDPVANLWDRYNSNRQGLIQQAYGINANGIDYSTKTEGYDPMLRDWSDYRGIPIYCIASSGDTLVPFDTNAKMLSDKLRGHNDFTLIDKGSAGHNSADRFDIVALRGFINKVCQGTIFKS